MPKGLSETEIEQRVAAGLTNSFDTKTSRSVKEIIIANVLTRINFIYFVLLLIVLSTGYYIDGLFGLLIIVNSGIGIFQEVRAKRTLDRLAILGQAKPVVVRSGKKKEILAKEIVRDDLVVLAVGDQILVDGPLQKTKGLEVDESLLTGEADPVYKEAGDWVRSGSFVVSGSGQFRAEKIGEDAYANELARKAQSFKKPQSELREGIDQILKYVTYALIPVAVLTIYNQLSGDLMISDALRGMVAALVPMVPEGLVLMTSVAMALGVIRLGQKQCLVQDLPAIEGLARVNVVCTDKTGTLTEAGLRHQQTLILDPNYTPADLQPVFEAIQSGEEVANESLRAIINSQNQTGVKTNPLRTLWTSIKIYPFSSKRKWSAAQFEKQGSWVLGAPDVILSDATALDKAHEYESLGLRVLTLIRAENQLVNLSELTDFTDFKPVALLVLEQKVRPEAKATLAYFKEQDVAVKVISGDNPKSVAAVVSTLNLPGANDPIDARQMPTQEVELAEIMQSKSVFGRVAPEQKDDFVRALQSKGNVVAMTGDGVNDVLALKNADVGVAMGAGSPAARAVARIVLLDNSFATLPYVVSEGRRVIGNIERVANLFLTKTVYSILLALLVALSGQPFPFMPRHITLIAWFTIGIPAFFLALAPNNERARSGFVSRVLAMAVPGGIAVGVSVYVSYLIARSTIADKEFLLTSSTAFLTLIIVAFWVLALVSRPWRLWKVILIAVMVLAMSAVLVLPLGQRIFQLSPWHPQVLLIGGAMGLVGILLLHLVRFVFAKKFLGRVRQ